MSDTKDVDLDVAFLGGLSFLLMSCDGCKFSEDTRQWMCLNKEVVEMGLDVRRTGPAGQGRYSSAAPQPAKHVPEELG